MEEPLSLLKDSMKNLQYSLDNISKCKHLCSKGVKVDAIRDICTEIGHLKKKTKDINFDLQCIESLLANNTKKKKNNYYYPETERENESGVVIPKTEKEEMGISPYQSSELLENTPNQEEMKIESSQISEKSVSESLYNYEGLENTPNTFISPYQLVSEEETEEEKPLLISKWDKQFMELRNNNLSSEETPMQLHDNFVAAATTYSKMIIGERHINIKDKKMQPLDVGGVAGGTKFLIHNLFFKYPVDACIDNNNKFYLYGGHEENNIYAAKATNHDLNGITYCMMADEKNEINYPLSALIDYQGFRLTVMTYLPISETTLIYGSGDGGETQLTDPEVHGILLNIASNLNLREHFVKKIKKTALCGDIEIHKLKQDDKEFFFGIDFARVFPPVVPVQPDSPYGSIFFRMLRPELVKKFKEIIPHGLSSDGLSGWQNTSDEHMNEDIVRASKFLIEQIDNFAKELCNEKSNHRFVKMAIENTKQPSFSGK